MVRRTRHDFAGILVGECATPGEQTADIYLFFLEVNPAPQQRSAILLHFQTMSGPLGKGHPLRREFNRQLLYKFFASPEPWSLYQKFDGPYLRRPGPFVGRIPHPAAFVRSLKPDWQHPPCEARFYQYAREQKAQSFHGRRFRPAPRLPWQPAAHRQPLPRWPHNRTVRIPKAQAQRRRFYRAQRACGAAISREA